MDDKERREFEKDAKEYGIPLMLDRMGMDGLGNEVVSLYKRILALEAEVAERDDFIDSLHSESGIPTRHWRERITQYVADLRAHAKQT